MFLAKNANRDLATMIRESVKHIDFGKVKLKEISLVEVAVDDDARVPVKQRRRGAHPGPPEQAGAVHLLVLSLCRGAHRRSRAAHLLVLSVHLSNLDGWRRQWFRTR